MRPSLSGRGVLGCVLFVLAAVARVGAGRLRGWRVRLGRVWWSWSWPAGSGRGGKRGQVLERGGESAGPGPGGWEAQCCGAGVEREASGDVQQAVAQAFGFGSGELAGEQQSLGPADEVVRERDDLQPDLVVGEVRNGRLRMPVSLSLRIWSSTRARPRWSRSSAGTGPVWSVRIAWKR